MKKNVVVLNVSDLNPELRNKALIDHIVERAENAVSLTDTTVLVGDTYSTSHTFAGCLFKRTSIRFDIVIGKTPQELSKELLEFFR